MENNKEVNKLLREFVKCRNLFKLDSKKQNFIKDSNLKLTDSDRIDFQIIEYVEEGYLFCEYYQHDIFSFLGAIARITYVSDTNTVLGFYRLDKSRVFIRKDAQKEKNGKIINTTYIINRDNKVLFTNESDNEEYNNYDQLSEFIYSLGKLGFTVLPQK